MYNLQVTYVGCADFPVFLFLIEGIKCFMPWLFAPGLSFPYPSMRLIPPQIPRPAPRATTRVCNTSTALLKNSINSILLIFLVIAVRFYFQFVHLKRFLRLYHRRTPFYVPFHIKLILLVGVGKVLVILMGCNIELVR